MFHYASTQPTPPQSAYLQLGMGYFQNNIFQPVVNNSVEAVFNELYAQWRRQTEFNSFIGSQTDGIYEKIVRLGYRVVPYIINKLKTENAHLFIALCRITGKNPVKKENMGNVRKMAEDWIHWWENSLHDDG
jgi:hypothetical protein